jgi:hypothetical protein
MPRPAKPTHLHVLEGTLRATRHRHRKLEPKPQGDLIDPPTWTWMDDEHKEMWREQLRACPAGSVALSGASRAGGSGAPADIPSESTTHTSLMN